MQSELSRMSSPWYAIRRFRATASETYVYFQGTLDKVVVVIKTADEKPLERFIFAVRNTLEVEAYNKDTR